MNETVLLACRDAHVVETVTALGLALEIQVTVADTSEELRRQWPTARLRLVGTDMVGRAVHLMPVPQVWVLGDSGDELVAASAELGVPALAVPDHVGRLAELMSQTLQPEPTARRLAVVGATGGLGASSVAVALATAAAADERVALVELADHGGGLDLLLGVETLEGYRWNQLAGARGELGHIDGLVAADGVDLLALDREETVHPDEQAAAAVLRSLSRSHGCIVMDVGLSRLGQWLADVQFLLLAPADVRGVAAARMVVEHHPVLAQAQLVVRRGAGRDLPATSIADALGMPLAGVLRQDPMVPRLAADGSSVAAPVARRFHRDVQRIWKVLES